MKRKIELLALLHDIGHLPFSHTFEFSLPLARYEFEKIFRRIGVRSTEKVHEAIGYYILSQYFKMNDIAELFKDIYLPNTEEEEVKFRILRLFINSSFDLNRLDYLFRDSYYAGVVYGKLSKDWSIPTSRCSRGISRLILRLLLRGGLGVYRLKFPSIPGYDTTPCDSLCLYKKFGKRG
ncbi:MAG: HD domain-containing protein [Sulfolobus sp.]|nr:HD domain-containing protein [Sulfolobus sp.]